ncbi:type II secretion system protein N [Vibrio algarum]|uniref:Type II secretion system protein N n=1 Tax=Vibrio algarum TaxID=3020714 RepID=A0ABT4YLW9_9VIBR|nr:type II secretion system protein N [Vibrio sp. KJ40-1]MDB1122493.1 type II secretion system protein N [Vibrio sp. KJ40-1]
MKHITLLIICFLTVLFISVVVHMPVSFALRYIPEMPSLKIDSPSGTIWAGEAQNIGWNNDNFGHATWQFQPLTLLQGKAHYSFRFGRGSDAKLMGKGNFGVGLSGVYAENVVVSMPAKNVLDQLSMPLPITVDGNLELSINEYIYAQPWCQTATGTLVWNGSQIGSPLGGLELGTVITDLKCEESRLTVTGEHNDNQLTASIKGELLPDQRYNVDALFKPNTEFPKAMKSQLRWLGRPNNNGEYPFTYAGKLN